MNYFASEVALTPHTKKLWANRTTHKEPEPIRFDDKPYVKQDNRPVKRYVKKRKVSREVLEKFQQNRLFSVIRGMK